MKISYPTDFEIKNETNREISREVVPNVLPNHKNPYIIVGLFKIIPDFIQKHHLNFQSKYKQALGFKTKI
ncbi:hypothetical protein GIB67_019750 [Kingdonia uniflora]|uniref:Uncharacterized protein n=1 Tax=Kingdonia uniflora TaxID=39325 RepID=A0A7J7MKA3_9MAGN|nr:hypothetical protein GIB67_019750 [Kingdonia uniflora]